METKPVFRFGPPSAVLRLRLIKLGLSVSAAAKILGCPRKVLSDILNDRSGVSAEMAIRLEKAGFGSSKSWVELNLAYNIWKCGPLAHNIHRGPVRTEQGTAKAKARLKASVDAYRDALANNEQKWNSLQRAEMRLGFGLALETLGIIINDDSYLREAIDQYEFAKNSARHGPQDLMEQRNFVFDSASKRLAELPWNFRGQFKA